MSYNKSDRNFIFSYPMKRLFCAIVLCLGSIILLNHNAYANCSYKPFGTCGTCPSPPGNFTHGSSPSGCNSSDNFCGWTYTSGVLNNDPLNPSASFGVNCCNWQDTGGSVQLPLGGVAAPISTSSAFFGGCGNNYDAMMVNVQTQDYTNSSINVPNYTSSQVTLSGGTPLNLACSDYSSPPTSSSSAEYTFYNKLCSNTLPSSCTATSSNLICAVPIACAILIESGSGVIWNDCQFVLFPPSPPPFCSTIELPVSPPVSVNICQEDTSPSENNICVLPSPDAGYGTTPVVNNFFTPSIRVAFDIQQPVPPPSPPSLTPPAEFVSVIPWIEGGSTTYTGAIPSLGATAPFASFGVLPKTSVATSPPSPPQNLELIYLYGSQTPPYSRYPYQNGVEGSLYGINIGQYCDLNYNLAINKALASTCTIIDTNGTSRVFSASLTCSSGATYNPYECTSICVTDVTSTGETVGSCSPIPNMPWPTVSACSSENTPTNFCLNYSFDNGTSTPYTGKIEGVAASPSNNTAPTQGTQSSPNPSPYYTSSIPNTSINLQAIVTDDKFNQPDITGNICLNASGQPAATPCPTYTSGYQPGGLYYLNGQYISGGTQFCYVPISGPASCVEGCTADNNTSNCNCVEANVISVPSSFPPTNPPATTTQTSVLIGDRKNPVPGDNSANNPDNPEQLLASSLSTLPTPATPATGLRGMNPLEAGLCVKIPQPISSYCPTVSDSWADCCAHLNSSPFAGGAWSYSLCGANGANCTAGDSACGDVCTNCYKPPTPPSASATPRPTS